MVVEAGDLPARSALRKAFESAGPAAAALLTGSVVTTAGTVASEDPVLVTGRNLADEIVAWLEQAERG